ncbi:hypothetical protein GQ457_09G013990 [Hibiscus cannabinus]
MEEHMGNAPSDLEKARRTHEKEVWALEKRITYLEAENFLVKVDMVKFQHLEEEVQKQKRILENNHENLKKELVELQGNLRRHGYDKTTRDLANHLTNVKRTADQYRRKCEAHKRRI